MTKITFLGTADSIPSDKRNHTAILLTSGAENILIDCGEGTQRQFRKAKLNPGKITRILISHWHGDHVLGLPGLLSTLALSGYNKKLFIYGPEGTEKKFWDALRVFGFKREYEIEFIEISEGKFFENNDFYLEASKMEHGIPCFAYSFVEKGHIRIKLEKVKELGEGEHLKNLKVGENIVLNGKKIKAKDCIFKESDKKVSIVMDTKNNKKIIPFVKNADVLISEGTYSSEMKVEAKEKMHLTVEEVSKIAEKAKVGRLFVTHISSRYMKNLSLLFDEAKCCFENVYFPRDLESFEL
ncbi:MAG: ribonuclease Z [Fusobacteriaceae bacterium]|nr:ribonuclease Z [Fusobacteriaceae bacterium]